MPLLRSSRHRQKPGPTAKARAKRRRAAMKVARTVRATVVDETCGRCERCGLYLGDYGHAHHKIPRSRGGKWTVENIEYLCPPCHDLAHRTNTL